MSSLRIEKLASCVSSDRHRVFDLCCDHGQIGLKAFSEKREIILIDKVPSIVEKIKDSDIPVGVKVLCADATNFKYQSKSTDAYIIAGIGGHLLVKILDCILADKAYGSEFILSPHSHPEALWTFLEERDFEGLAYSRMEEHGKFYEILKLKLTKNHKFRALEFLKARDKSPDETFLMDQIKHYKIKSKHEPDQLYWLSFYERRLSFLKRT